jgi:HEAT repeat protein
MADRSRGDPMVEAMLEELQAAGIATDDFGTFTRLRPTTVDYARAVPILLAWLPRIESLPAKVAIARSLTSEPEASRLGAARVLVDEFAELDDEEAKWAIGNALATLADESIADDLIRLMRKPEHGKGREMLCDALKRTGDPRTPDVLVELLDDDAVAGHAIFTLRSYGPKASLPLLRNAREKLEQVVERSSSTTFARTQTKKALQRLGNTG